MSSSLSTIPGLLPLPVFIEEANAHPEEATWAEISPSVVLKTPEEFSAAIAPLAIPEEWQFAEAYILTISSWKRAGDAPLPNWGCLEACAASTHWPSRTIAGLPLQ